VELQRGSLSQLVIHLDEEPVRTHVVDERGEPVVGAWVTLYESEGGVPVSVDDSGLDGWADLYGVPQRMLIANLTHKIGLRFGIPFDGRDPEQKLVLEASCALELYAHDAGTPLPGVDLRLETKGGTALTRNHTTGDDGMVRLDALGSGHYRIVGRRSDIWTSVVERTLSGKEVVRVEIELRRLGDLQLQVHGTEGERLKHVAVSLECIDLGASVEDWIASGRVEGPQGLVTDGEGALVVERLPRGRYAWEVGGQTGSFVLEAGIENRIEIRLAP
jgi:hypothetical protein